MKRVVEGGEGVEGGEQGTVVATTRGGGTSSDEDQASVEDQGDER